MDCISEWLSIVKPVPMWSVLFSLLESLPAQQDETQGLGWEAVKDRVIVAATPAKKVPPPTSILPPALVLTGIPTSAPDTNLQPLLVQNFNQLQQSFNMMAKELARIKAHSEQQATTIATLLDKINVVAGFVGSPDPFLMMPTLWQAAHHSYNCLLELQARIQEPHTTDQSDLEGLVEALEQDQKTSIQHIARLETKHTNLATRHT